MGHWREISERRKDKRFQAPRGAFAVLVREPDFAQLGQIVDIGRHGLAFRYMDKPERGGGSLKLDILLRRRNFCLEGVAVKTISDFEIDNQATNPSHRTRRRGVKFLGLTHNQKFELEHFIRNYTTGEAGR
jgi:hypothetical protein